MNLFLDILGSVTLPIIILIALGWLLQPKLKLDVGSLNRLQVYVVMPCFLVHFLASGKQPLSVVWPVFYLGIVQFLILIPLGWLCAIVFRLRPSLGPVMGIGAAYANVGFFGIPVTQLAFGPDYLIYQSVLTALMAVFTVTGGLLLLAPGGTGLFSKLKTVFETPLVPAVALGLALRGFDVTLPALVSQPLQFLGGIFTPLALYTLGAQLALQTIRFEALPQVLIVFLKFLLAPALTFGLCRAMGFPDDVSDVLVVAAATPVGVLITIFAAEYKNEPEFLSTAVVVTTVLSPVVVSAWIAAVRLH